jgi:hypothetical protein
MKTAESLLGTGLQSILDLADGRTDSMFQALSDTTSWISDSWGSILEDPLWHASWTMDVQRKWIHAVSIMGKQLPDPRIKGLI